MHRFNILVILLVTFFNMPGFSGTLPCFSEIRQFRPGQEDTINDNQNLYNGKIWSNLYYMIEGDQFLFSKDFLPGSLTINGKTYADIYLKYDIFKDEILTPVDPGGILQLNKEMVDSFSLFFQNVTYRFIKLPEENVKGSTKYFNILYKGKTALYLLHTKKIDKLSIEGNYDEFYQFSRIFFVKDSKSYQISSKNDLIKVLIEDKDLIKKFIKRNKSDISVRVPESFIPVIRYYDSIIK